MTTRKVSLTVPSKYREIKGDDLTGHGGWREGAGRPAGAKNMLTRAKDRVLRDAMVRYHNQVDRLTPLEIVEAIMREALKAGDLERTVAAASLALPYRHPRLAPIAAPDPNAATVDEIAADFDPEVMEAGRLTG